MSKLRNRLKALVDRFVANASTLKNARAKYKKCHLHVLHARANQVKTQHRADQARANNHPKLAARLDLEATQYGQKAYKAHQRAQYWLGAIKATLAKQQGLTKREDNLKAQIEKWKKEHGVVIDIPNNKVTGGDVRKRLAAALDTSAAQCASGARHNFYSQAGSWDVNHCLTGESYGERSDCSSWFTSVYKCCELDDPNGTGYTGGYTGTLISGKIIPESELQPGDAVIYGSPGATHHVEAYRGPGDKTIGHGSAPVDAGVVNLFGDSNYNCVRYV